MWEADNFSRKHRVQAIHSVLWISLIFKSYKKLPRVANLVRLAGFEST